MKRASVLHTNHSYDHVVDERDVFGKYVFELGQVMQPVQNKDQSKRKTHAANKEWNRPFGTLEILKNAKV